MDLARAVLREPGAQHPVQFCRRTDRLALVYALLFVSSLGGLVVLLLNSRLFITLAQRTNVETLVLAFFIIFFCYVAALSSSGALGALQVGRFALQRLLGATPLEVERAKRDALSRRRRASTTAALNVAVASESRPGSPVVLRVADAAGELGQVVFDGARVEHRGGYNSGSNELLAFASRQLADVLPGRCTPGGIEVVSWKKISDEDTEQYLSLVSFATQLARRLGDGPLWPTVTLNDAQCTELERRFSAICPALRSEAFLPDWEFSGEHKVPIIPEPLGLISLSRTERRVDPLASMLGALGVVLAVIVLMVLLLVRPPWVPGV